MDDTKQGRAPQEQQESASLTLREERLTTRSVRVPRERVTLRRRVVTEEQTITVPVRREIVEVVREPLDEGADATPPDTDDGEPQVLVLREERPVIQTEVVETERVWLQRYTVRQVFSETHEVAHEEVDVLGDVD